MPISVFRSSVFSLLVVISGVPGAEAQAQNVQDPRVIPTPVTEAHWTFDDDAADYSGHARHGSLEGLATITTEGRIGGALDLRNGDGHADIDDPVLSQEQSCGISYWVRKEPDAPATLQAVFATDGYSCGGAAGDGLHANLNSVVPTTWTAEVALCSYGSLQTSFPADDQWVHMAFVYDSYRGSMDAYQNGRLVATDVRAAGALCGDGHDSAVGAWDQLGMGLTERHFDGRIDDLRIYSGELLPSTVAALAGATDVIFSDNFEWGTTSRWNYPSCQNIQFVTQEVALVVTSPGQDAWQSFRPWSSGNLVAVSLRPERTLSGISGNLNIYDGEGISRATLVHTQSYSLPSQDGSPWTYFLLTTPVPMQSGFAYTWELTGTVWGANASLTDVYPGGVTSGSFDYTMRLVMTVCN